MSFITNAGFFCVRFAMTYHNGRVYTICGKTEQCNWHTEVEYYDMAEKKWYECPDAPERLVGLTACGIGEYVYVFYDQKHLCSLSEKTKEWDME